MSVQNGDFEIKKKESSYIIPDYKQLARLSEEDKNNIVEGMVPLTEAMWQKVKNAAGKDHDKLIVRRCVYRLARESSASEVPTRSRQLLKSIYEGKRATFTTPQTLQFEPNFAINWSNNGLYELGGIQKKVRQGCLHQWFQLSVMYGWWC